MDDPEFKDELIDTPFLSPLLDSDDESDDRKVLNELDEYWLREIFYPNRIINSFDEEDLAFPCMISFRKFVAYFNPVLPMNIITRKAYNTIMVEGLKSTRRNLVAIVRDVYVFVGSFTYVTDFVVLEDIGEFIVSGMTDVVMGRSFRAVTQLEDDYIKGLISFSRIFDTYIFLMPRTIPRLKNFEWRRTSSLRDLILRFKQGDDEPIKSAWMHFQDLIKQVPHHGIPNGFWKSKTPKGKVPNFSITTRLGVSTQDPPVSAPPQSTSANHTEGATKKEGHKGAEPSIIQEPAPRPSIFYHPSKSSNLPFSQRLRESIGESKKVHLPSLLRSFGDGEDELVPIILGRPFLATIKAVIDVHEGKLSLRVESATVTFNIGKSMKSKHSQEEDSNEVHAVSFYPRTEPVEPLEWKALENQLKPSCVEPPELKLKELPKHLEYAFFQENNQLPVVISSVISAAEKSRLLEELIEDSMEVFLDDFSVFGSSFDHYLKNLEKMLKRCEETNLVLNWENFHFMVKEGIVLGHKVSGSGIEVDKEKIKAISRLPYLMNMKAIRSVLRHCDDQIIRRCVAEDEAARFLRQCHSRPSGGHHGIATTTRKVFEARAQGLPAIKNCNLDLTKAEAIQFLQINELHEIRLDAYESSISYKERTKEWHDKQIKAPTNYERGDKILLFNLRLRLFLEKLKSRWYGPFSVCNDMKNCAIKLYDENGNEFIVNKQRMKPYQKSVLDTNKNDDITLDDEGEVT
nr:RNA-directed DNA polymerase homolog [Tanacetum cinerariifolium]